MNSLEIKKRAFMSVVTRRYGFIRTKSGAPPLTLTNCLSGNLVDYKIFGNVGKNLLDFPEAYTFKGFINKKVNIPAGQYTVSCTSSVLGGSEPPVIRFIDNNKYSYLGANGGSKNVNFAQPETTIYMYSNGYNATGSVGVTSTVNGLMLELGEAATEYEPYKRVGDLDGDKYKIPITVGNNTTNIFLSAPLGTGESIDYKTDNLPDIFVSEGTNIISAETEIKPSVIEVKYRSSIEEG